MIVTRNVRVRSRAAFTLMEVMVAAAILVVGILVAKAISAANAVRTQ